MSSLEGNNDNNDEFYDSSNSTTFTNSDVAAEVVEEEETIFISAYFVIFSFLLTIVIILSKLLHDHPRIKRILPEAGMILLTGVIFGGIFELAYSSPDGGASDSIISSVTAAGGGTNTSSNSNIMEIIIEESTNYTTNIGGNNTHQAATTIASAMEGEIIEDAVTESMIMSFSPEIFFLVLLPPIIFNSGYHLRSDLFFRYIIPICLFAIIGTTVSAVIIAVTLQLLLTLTSTTTTTFQPKFTELLTFGALLSATDPVTTLAVFQEKSVSSHLFYLVFGESVLNDAIGLILFHAFGYLVTNTSKEDNSNNVIIDTSEFITGFAYDSLGSPILGYASSLVSAYVFKVLDMRSTPLLELLLFILIMYVPFLIALLLDLSGIITILFSGLAAQVYVAPNLSKMTIQNSDVLFRLFAHLAETAIFLELGLSVFALKGSIQPMFILWTIIACLLGRACNIYPITFCFNQYLRRTHYYRRGVVVSQQCDSSGDGVVELTTYKDKPENGFDDNNNNNHDDTLTTDINQEEVEETEKPMHKEGEMAFEDEARQGEQSSSLLIASNTAHMLWYSGLRGAVAYACVRSFPDRFGHADEFTMTTMIIVLVSVFGLGSTTECILQFLRIEMNVINDDDDDGNNGNNNNEITTIGLGKRRQPQSNIGFFARLEECLYNFVVRNTNNDGTHDHEIIITNNADTESTQNNNTTNTGPNSTDNDKSRKNITNTGSLLPEVC